MLAISAYHTSFNTSVILDSTF